MKKNEDEVDRKGEKRRVHEQRKKEQGTKEDRRKMREGNRDEKTDQNNERVPASYFL